VAKFKYFRTTVTNKNCIHNETKRRLNVGNNCYNSVKSLSPFILPINTKIKIYKNIILPLVLYRYETWSLTVREEHRLWVFENRALRRIFGPKREEVAGGGRRLRRIIRVVKSIRMR
jgi:hypothetical protein